jgi:two-component system response regulator HydG
MTPGLQLKLLRVLQEKEFERVGGEETIKVDVRVISAPTGLKKEVEAGRFREDLFYRLHVVPCEVPPLRERREDIPLLVAHFIEKHGPRINPQVDGIDDAALARLAPTTGPATCASWRTPSSSRWCSPAATHRRGGAARLPARGRRREHAGRAVGRQSLPEILEDLERQLIQRAYDKTGGVKTETRALLGIKTSALYYKLEKYGIGVIAGRPAARRPSEPPERRGP